MHCFYYCLFQHSPQKRIIFLLRELHQELAVLKTQDYVHHFQLQGGKGITAYSFRFNATFNNISVILWLSVLLVEETGVPGENYRPAEQQPIRIGAVMVVSVW
jgi:hypothetical protein